MVISRVADRISERRVISEAQIKPARSTDTKDFEYVAGKFREAVMKIRAAMEKAGSKIDYSNFFGGYEQCEVLLQDPAFRSSQDAIFEYNVFLGVDQWLRHESDKLGQNYIPPNHFFKAWLLADPPIDLRNLNV